LEERCKSKACDIQDKGRKTTERFGNRSQQGVFGRRAEEGDTIASEKVVVKVTAIVCLTALGMVYFVTIRQDSTVLLTLSSIIGGIVGYEIGKRRLL